MPKDPNEVYKEVIYIRPPTQSRSPLRILVTQRKNEDGELCLSSATILGKFDPYLEKPDLLLDLSWGLHKASRIMQKLNRGVK